jgi:hypothetical protein
MMGEDGLVGHAALEEVTETGEIIDEKEVKRITKEKKRVEIVTINVIEMSEGPLHEERTKSDTKTLLLSTHPLLHVSHPHRVLYRFLNSN